MTAIDVAVQSRRLGAEDVTIVYRRGREQMGASRFEQELAQGDGVRIRHWGRPVRILGESHVTGVEFEYTRDSATGSLQGTGEFFTLPADVVFKAIGQALIAGELDGAVPPLRMEGGRIAVDAERRTSLENVWAGGDCVAGGEDLTVVAVQDGKLAALSIDRYLRAER
jgi:glutamate synthase (NADPH/NADH) small chain